MAKPQPLLAEYVCRDCGMPFLNAFPLDEHGRCALCRAGLNGFDAAYSYGSFEGELRQLIHLFKYGRIRTLDGPLGDLLALALPRAERFDIIAPMPMHWWRRWRRGFNQAELLARTISKRASVPVRNVARRAKWTLPQAGLTNARRRENVKRAFRVTSDVAGKRILLVDDVLTTGATAGACAAALKAAGAARVAVLTVARVDRRINAAAYRPAGNEFSAVTSTGSLENAGSRSIT
jgi:ComF family protein